MIIPLPLLGSSGSLSDRSRGAKRSVPVVPWGRAGLPSQLWSPECQKHSRTNVTLPTSLSYAGASIAPSRCGSAIPINSLRRME